MTDEDADDDNELVFMFFLVHRYSEILMKFWYLTRKLHEKYSGHQLHEDISHIEYIRAIYRTWLDGNLSQAF